MQIQSPAESSSLTWSMQIHFCQQLRSSPFTMVSAETLSNKVIMLHSGQCRTICQHDLHPSQWPMQIHCPTRSSRFTVVSADPSTVQKGLHFSQWLMPIQCLHPSQRSVQRDPLSNTVFTLHSGKCGSKVQQGLCFMTTKANFITVLISHSPSSLIQI